MKRLGNESGSRDRTRRSQVKRRNEREDLENIIALSEQTEPSTGQLLVLGSKQQKLVVDIVFKIGRHEYFII